MLVKAFHGPSMVVAAAEEGNLVQGRGDAYCGMLNASYNLKLRNLKAYIPEYPVGTAEEVAEMINEFAPIARAVVALKNLKIISFGPRPANFLACNAPIKRLYDLGVEIEENSELDLFEAFNKHADDPRCLLYTSSVYKRQGVYRTIYYSVQENHEMGLYYGRETLGIAIAMVLGIILVFEIPQKTINRLFGDKALRCV